MLGSGIRFVLAVGLCMAALLSTALGTAAPVRAQNLAWLGGDTVEIAPNRMGLNGSQSNEPLLGYLAKPEAPGRHPAVVVLHGCGGFSANYPVIADVLKSYGYVALALDSLGEANACVPHGLGSLVEAHDAYTALDWLTRQDFVNPDRVAVLGFSMGAKAVFNDVQAGGGAAEKAERRHFSAAIGFYPNCRSRAGIMTVPTLILVGDKDDWALASWCREMMARRNGKGAPVKLVIYPGATHAFNVPGRTRDYLGHHLAYDPQATAAAWKEVREFLQMTLDATPAAESR
ncbi:MAG TPA: dienelactone hydrolase family protein [Stellaceae bacterium]|nr:dienelactone hydrolase family protein [Stellaceae bacterium]